MPSSPAELSRRIGEEMKMWNDVIVRNAVKVE
jgi:hypothetical protein